MTRPGYLRDTLHLGRRERQAVRRCAACDATLDEGAYCNDWCRDRHTLGLDSWGWHRWLNRHLGAITAVIVGGIVVLAYLAERG